MSTWTAEPIGMMWIVINPVHPDGRALASRIRADGTRSRVWDTRDAAERAAFRLNRKYRHECIGLYGCPDHPVTHVVRARAARSEFWEVWDWETEWAPTAATFPEAFAVALDYARNAAGLTPEPTC